MQNNLKAFKEVTLNGEVVLLKFDFNAVCDLEDYYNKGIAGILNEEQIGLKLVRAFYWAGLKWKHKTLTIEVMGRMLNKHIQETGDNVMDLMEPAMDALKASRLLGTNKKGEFDEDDNEDPREIETIESEVQDPNE